MRVRVLLFLLRDQSLNVASVSGTVLATSLLSRITNKILRFEQLLCVDTQQE